MKVQKTDKAKAKRNKKHVFKHSLNIRHIVIERSSRATLRKIKEPIWGNVLNAIECGNWYIPFDTYEYRDIKEHLEKEAFIDFFHLPKDTKIVVKSFDTDILSFEKGH